METKVETNPFPCPEHCVSLANLRIEGNDGRAFRGNVGAFFDLCSFPFPLTRFPDCRLRPIPPVAAAFSALPHFFCIQASECVNKAEKTRKKRFLLENLAKQGV